MSSILSKLINLAGNITGTLAVGNGGTGNSTLTNNGVLIGAGTSATTAVTGTTSQVLIGGSGPTFGNVPAAALPSATSSTQGAVIEPGSMVVCDSPNGYGATNTVIRRFTNSTTTGSDITYADSAANGGSFTINAAGIYAISRWDGGSVATAQIGISVNSNQLTTNINSITTANRIGYNVLGVSNDIAFVSTVYRFAANDVVRAHDSAAFSNTGASNQLIITQVFKF